MTVVYGVLAILLLGVLVLVHEAGHFLAARWTGVPVHEFAVGFGKRILSTKRGGVIYALRLIPFGGFVSFADPEDEHGVEKYYATSPWKRMVVSVAGSLTRSTGSSAPRSYSSMRLQASDSWSKSRRRATANERRSQSVCYRPSSSWARHLWRSARRRPR